MTVEPDTAPEMDATVSDENFSDDDTSNDYDYFDPDEDQDTEEVEQSEETDDEPDEAQAENEAEGQEAEEPETPEDPDLAAVKMDDGSEVQLAELKKGYLRQSDYTRKAQEVANDRNALKQDAERMERINTVFVDHLSKLVPAAPDASLAYSDPNAYTAQKAQHEAAMAEVQRLIQLADEPKAVGEGISNADKQKAMREANTKLVEMFPEVAGGEGRKQFFEGVAETATGLGFSAQELSATTDPRIFALAHWAKKGMAAEQSAAKAKEKVEKAPPATPRKPGQGARRSNGNAAAMRKLGKSGSLKDALAVDFD